MNLRIPGCVGLAVLIACGGSTPDRDPVLVTIPRGASLSAVVDTLSAHRVTDSPRLFKFYATVTGRQREIQAGTYLFRPGSSIRGVLSILVAGREALVPLVLPEGLMLSEVAERISLQIGIDPDSILQAARDTALRWQLAVPAPTLEGYLYPSTYYVRRNASAQEVVRQMVDEFELRWRPEWNLRLDSLAMTRHELVTLASIIEGEVRYAPDRKFVASVYSNRLRRRMRLQADPTVVYALGKRRRLFQKDYQTPSPYNTYLIDGLPPGPITQPSTASIEAALWPAKTNFLYFVARPDGKHVFSRSLREHQTAVRTIRRQEIMLGLRPPR